MPTFGAQPKPMAKHQDPAAMSSINGNDLTYPLIGDEGKSTMLTAADEDDPTFGVNSDGKVG